MAKRVVIEWRSRYRGTANRHRNRPSSNQIRSAGTALKDIDLNDGMGAYFGKQFIEHAGRASANALLLGTPLDKALEGALLSSLPSTGTAFGADACLRRARLNAISAMAQPVVGGRP